MKKKIIISLFLTLCVFSSFGWAEEFPKCPAEILNSSWLKVVIESENPNNYFCPPQLIQDSGTSASAAFSIKDINIFLNDLKKTGIKELELPDEFSNQKERILKDQLAAQVFALYYTAFNNGNGKPIDFCLGDINYSNERTDYNGWSVTYMLFHATHKKNIVTGQYEGDKMEYRIFSY